MSIETLPPGTITCTRKMTPEEEREHLLIERLVKAWFNLCFNENELSPKQENRGEA